MENIFYMIQLLIVPMTVSFISGGLVTYLVLDYLAARRETKMIIDPKVPEETDQKEEIMRKIAAANAAWLAEHQALGRSLLEDAQRSLEEESEKTGETKK